MTFADQLTKHRKRLRLTQKAVADLLTLPLRTYIGYETGAVVPHEIAQEGALARLKKLKPAKSDR